MGGHVTIGMANQPLFARPEQPGQVQRAAGSERVDVDADAYPGQLKGHVRPEAVSGGEDLVE